MKKLLSLLVMLILVLTLMGCTDPDDIKDADDQKVVNTDLIENISEEIKDVFEAE
jgi:uncharacterized protein YcfL